MTRPQQTDPATTGSAGTYSVTTAHQVIRAADTADLRVALNELHRRRSALKRAGKFTGAECAALIVNARRIEDELADRRARAHREAVAAAAERRRVRESPLPGASPLDPESIARAAVLDTAPPWWTRRDRAAGGRACPRRVLDGADSLCIVRTYEDTPGVSTTKGTGSDLHKRR